MELRLLNTGILRIESHRIRIYSMWGYEWGFVVLFISSLGFEFYESSYFWVYLWVTTKISHVLSVVLSTNMITSIHTYIEYHL